MSCADMIEMNLYVSTTFFPDNSLVGDVLEVCVREGIRNVEIGSNHAYECDPGSVIRQYECQYLVHNYFPVPEEPFVVNIASVDEVMHQRSVDHLLKAIDFCREIGASLYTFHPGFLTDPKGPNKDASNYDFQFREARLKQIDYEQAFGKMLEAASQAVSYAEKRLIRVAIETQGSISKAGHLLMQRPEEYQKLFEYFSPHELGVNLNIGHLRLSANAFRFETEEFVDLISDYVVAMELSHNEGALDEHRPLVEGEWYWGIITDPRLVKAYKILEVRDTSIGAIVRNLALLRGNLGSLVT